MIDKSEKGSFPGNKDQQKSVVADYNCEEYRSGGLLTDLLHAASHEIGNPLTSIISLATIIERIASEALVGQGTDKLVPIGKLRDYSHSILKEAWRISAVVQNVVSVVSSRVVPDCVSDLEETLWSAVQRLRKIIPAQAMTIETSFNYRSREIAIDAEQLKILFSAMLTKAYLLGRGKLPSANLSDLKEPPLPISLSIEEVGQNVEICVSVLSKEPLDRETSSRLSFRPVLHAADDGKNSLNLELAACLSIVERYRGTIALQELHKPEGYVLAINASIPKFDSELNQGDNVSDEKKALKVLLVDAEEMVSAAIRRILALSLREFSSVEFAGVSWLQFVSKEKYRDNSDVIICDLGNGQKFGFNSFLCDLDNTVEIRNKMGFMVDERIPESLSGLGRPVLNKPFEIDELCSFVRNIGVNGNT